MTDAPVQNRVVYLNLESFRKADLAFYRQRAAKHHGAGAKFAAALLVEFHQLRGMTRLRDLSEELANIRSLYRMPSGICLVPGANPTQLRCHFSHLAIPGRREAYSNLDGVLFASSRLTAAFTGAKTAGEAPLVEHLLQDTVGLHSGNIP